MSSTTFILLGVTYYIVALIIIIIVLNIINNKEKKKYQAKIALLERDKNLIISTGILTELNKVENLVNNDAMQKLYTNFQNRFEDIKNNDIPKISEDLDEIVELFSKKDYKELQKKVAKIEYEIYYVKTKSNYLLDEIKEITLSEDRNREIITKLKAHYREIIAKYSESSAYITSNNNLFLKSILHGFIQVSFYYLVTFFVYKSLGLTGANILLIYSHQAMLYCMVVDLIEQ